MKHIILALGLLAASALPAAAQAPTPRPSPTPASVEKSLIGTWEGPYQSEQAPPGLLRLVISKDTAWKATLGVITDQDVPAGEVQELKINGENLSWVQEIMGMTCRSSASLEAGSLKGETSCEQGGAVAITASFVLLKK